MYVTLGKIVNTRGLKGELKILSLSDFASLRYQENNKVFLYNEKTNSRVEMSVLKHQKISNFDYLFLNEVTSVDDANKYRNFLIQVEIDTLPKLEEDEYYYHELLECLVYDSKNSIVGVVKEIMETGAHKILRIKGKTKDHLIPFIDEFIKEVDIKNKKIQIKEIEGLL